MISAMFKRIIWTAFAFIVLAVAPLASRAAEEKEPYDGRLEGYGKVVTLDTGGTALDWLLVVGLGVLALGGMFKSANRSHLD